MALVKYNNNSISSVTATASLPAGGMTHIKTVTASSSATISFVNGTSDVVLDDTYPIYVFKVINAHPGTDNINFTFNGSDDTSSHSYDISKTTSVFNAYHKEDDSEAAMGYNTYDDLANGTGFQSLSSYGQQGTDNDMCLCSEIYLFNPSSTTYVTHFICRTQWYQREDRSIDVYTAGYFNTTAAITAIQFKMSSGNIDAGTFKLYGIKDS